MDIAYTDISSLKLNSLEIYVVKIAVASAIVLYVKELLLWLVQLLHFKECDAIKISSNMASGGNMEQKNMDDEINSFMDECQDLMDEYHKGNTLIEKDKVFYHYTSWESLCAILASGYLRLASFRHVNDELELQYCIDLINKSIKENTNISRKHFWDFFLKELNSKSLNHLEAYLASFCSRSNCLPAWRWYGVNAAGSAIGFKFQIRNNIPTSSELSIKAIKVNYNENGNFDLLIKNIVLLAESTFENVLNKIKLPDNRKYFCRQLAMNLTSAFIELFPQIKHAEYKAEDELRLCLQSMPEMNPIPAESLEHFNNDQDKPDFVDKYIKEKVAYKMPFEKTDIYEIIIGPRCNFEKAKHALLDEILKHGYEKDNIKISQPDLFYRG